MYYSCKWTDLSKTEKERVILSLRVSQGVQGNLYFPFFFKHCIGWSRSDWETSPKSTLRSCVVYIPMPIYGCGMCIVINWTEKRERVIYDDVILSLFLLSPHSFYSMLCAVPCNVPYVYVSLHRPNIRQFQYGFPIVPLPSHPGESRQPRIHYIRYSLKSNLSTQFSHMSTFTSGIHTNQSHNAFLFTCVFHFSHFNVDNTTEVSCPAPSVQAFFLFCTHCKTMYICMYLGIQSWIFSLPSLSAGKEKT